MSWLPGGRVNGKDFEVGSLQGEAGRSLRINMQTGAWKDFAAGDYGKDLISLFAAIRGLSQVEAAKELAGKNPPPSSSVTKGKATTEHPVKIVAPPKGTKRPSFKHPRHGDPVTVWTYRGAADEILFFVGRYHDSEGKKQFIPWCWEETQGRWVNKMWPAPRPLYGLEQLVANPTKHVLLVEGEKAADAARKILGEHSSYVVVTWSGGASGHAKSDFTPLYNRPVLLWPDADEPGVKAMREIGAKLVMNCPEVKILDVMMDAPATGEDAADLLAGGWDLAQWRAWAAAHVKVIARPISPPKPEPAKPKAAKPEPEEINRHAAWDKLGLVCGPKSGPIINIMNVTKVLAGWEPLRGCVWFDEFYQRIRTNIDGTVREWRDSDDIGLTLYLQSALGLHKMQPRVVRDAVEAFAHQNIRNEPKDWMEGLQWDGVARVADFFVRGLGAEQSDYTLAASKNWWTALVARVYRPGCKFDNMVVLEGNQGKFKSTALGLIGGPWFMESSETIGTKDFLQSLNGKLIVEIAELDSFSKVGVLTIKKTISCQIDTYRASYGHRSRDFPRQCVFVGTTNEDEYLEDPTGGRRFWPVKTNTIDLAYIQDVREQLFAEAVALFKSGATWWEMPASAADEQLARQRSDAWAEPVISYLTGKERVRLSDVAEKALDFEHSRFDRRSQLRLAAVLRGLGWEKRVTRIDNRFEKIWFRAGPVTHVQGGVQTVLPLHQPTRVVRNYAPSIEDLNKQ